MKIFRKRTEKMLIKELISILKKSINSNIKAGKRFSFVLTGGPSPRLLYKNLPKYILDWSKIDLFWGDERFVSQKSKNSNYRLAKTLLLDKLNINKRNIFKINTNFKNVQIASKNYSKNIKEYFGSKKIIFDTILLGMGFDGHVASIFNDKINLKEKKITEFVFRPDFKRISLSLNTINKSKKIFLLLNNKKLVKIYKDFKLKKAKVPVNFLNKKKLILFIVE
tara:strand:- start:1400 stop:2068 length:669 start_codon:yes stop_codon:yes gene_type:complete